MVVDIIYNSINTYFLKEEGLDYINDKCDLREIFLVVVLMNIIFGLIETFLFGTNMLLLLTIGITIVFTPFFIWLGGLITYGMLRLFGGKGEFNETFKFLLAISFFPTLILSLLSLIVKISSNLLVLSIIYLIVAIIFLIFTIRATTTIMSTIHEISKLRAFFAVYFIPIFLMIFAVVAVVGFQTWFNMYQSDITTKVEAQSNIGSSLTIERLEAMENQAKVYVKTSNEAGEVSGIKILNQGTEVCNSIGKNLVLTPPITSIELDCSSSLESGSTYNVVAISSSGVYSENEIAR